MSCQYTASLLRPFQGRVRLAKRARLIESGIDPYPVNFPRTHTAAELRARFAGLPADAATGEQAAVAGRVMLSRVGGKLCFATLRDGSGDIQVMISLAGGLPDTVRHGQTGRQTNDRANPQRLMSAPVCAANCFRCEWFEAGW